MSVVVTVYSTKAFKEFLLPAVDNSDHSLLLHSTLFGLPDDYELKMEIINGKWYFLRDEDTVFHYVVKEADYAGEALEDGDVLYTEPVSGNRISIIVRETADFFAVFKKYDLRSGRDITIGKDQSNVFSYNFFGLVSRNHAKIAKKGNQYVIFDESANGTFVNSKRIVGNCQLSFGDCIDIFGLRIVFLGSFIAVNTMVKDLMIQDKLLTVYQPVLPSDEPERRKKKPQKVLFHRSPRNIPKIETEPVEIEAPPAPQTREMQPTFLAIGPSMTMALPMLMGCALSIYSTRLNGGAGAGVFMYTGLVTAIGSALTGSIWAVVNMKQAKKKNKEEENKRFEAYGQYLVKVTNEIKSKYERNIAGMHAMYPEAAVCCGYTNKSPELWNRNNRHEDFLTERLGTGALPFQVKIDIPKERFNLVNDSLAEKPKMIRESYRMMQNVPVCVDLYGNKLVGIVGGRSHIGCYPIMHALSAQIAACNCYTDVKLAYIYDETTETGENVWGFTKWLPHVWSEDKKTRYVAGNKNDASEVLYEITNVLRMRAEDKTPSSSTNKEVIPKPYYILFLENPDSLEGELISKYIFDNESNCGITTIMMTESVEELPNACEFIIENTPSYSGMYSVADGLEDRIQIHFDHTEGKNLEQFARRLSQIEVKEVETGGEIPSVLTFFDMYGVNHLSEFNVIDRWRKNRTYETIKALVGQKAGGTDCYLDVHEKYHGPHGLVAGTTGSGKSETLQTYMLSLALNYSPDDIGFFIIDYKGGGMANLFNGLPHILGQISNLSGNQVRRAMVSIKSENLRRQRIFNEHGVNNINLYTRLFKNNEAKIPVPHLFIIIDEFAELKREEPDFMRELISVAQVGRSLGVHLILATQKPSGTVDDNIWSNSKFRLCLRVQDRQDSTDMLHRPDAAYITQAGRCYLQVGNDELFELFQSAWSGAIYNEEEGSIQTEIAKMLGENGKAALVGSHAKIKQKERARRTWISQLLGVIQAAAGQMHCDIRTVLADKTVEAELSRRTFAFMTERGIEYPDNEFNQRRMQDLVGIYAEVIAGSNNGYDGMELNEISDLVIRRAMAEGKKLPEMKEKTQLDAVVEYLGRVAKDNGYINNLMLWLPVLPEMLYLHELSGYDAHEFNDGGWIRESNGFTLETIVGLYDDPVNQAQNPLVIDLAKDGNHAIIGTVVSGKSTFLQTYIYSLVNRYAPDVVNLYLLDYSSNMLSAFDGLAHVGGVMTENDEERVSKFFTMMDTIVQERKRLFKGGSYSQYIQANGVTVPAIVIAIDNMAAFRAKTNSAYDDALLTLLKEGVGYGIFIIATAAGFSMNEIPNRMGDNFRSIICLEMNDKFAYTDALRTLHLDVLPEENVKGRGLAKIGESILEFQTALSFEADDDFKRSKAIKERCNQLNSAWTGKKARAIPEIPENPVWSEFEKLPEFDSMIQESSRLPVGYDKKNATVYGINLMRTYTYLISGKGRTGKTNALRLLILSAAHLGGKIAVIDFAGDLRGVSEKVDARYISTNQELFDYFMEISPDFKARNVDKKDFTTRGFSDEEIYEKMQIHEKLYLFIGDLNEFVFRVHNPGEGVGAMAPFVSTLLDKGAMHNVYWFGCLNQDDMSKSAGLDVMNLFVRSKKGMHLGGNVSAQRYLAFDHVPYLEQSKSQKPGIAMLSTDEEESTNTLVLPFYKADSVG
ncbi:MAG: type VII secretion protein EssC [Lachnospiraceae bacterium]|nr:type VII secretion protein EssC [Lachnospiraceae bacterium]